MTEPHTDQPDTQDAVLSLQQSFQESLAKQRAAWRKLSQIVSDESIRFATSRVQKTVKTLEQLDNTEGDAKSLMAGQQQWLRDMVKDYADQNVRYSQMFGQIAANSFSAVVANARDSAHKARDLAEEGAAEVEETANVARSSARDVADNDRDILSSSADSMKQAAETGASPDSNHGTHDQDRNAN